MDAAGQGAVAVVLSAVGPAVRELLRTIDRR